MTATAGEGLYRNPSDWKIEPVYGAMADTLDYPSKMLGLDKLWKETEGEGIKVAVLDTGCDLDHPDLKGAILEARDFTGSPHGPRDLVDHGTWCAGVIGARADGNGIRGIAPKCQLLIGKVLDDRGYGTDGSVLGGLEWAFSMGADIISMSLGGPAMPESVLLMSRKIVMQSERFLIGAAGNEGQKSGDTVNYPAKWEEYICVGAVDQNGNRAPFSSRGKRVDIVAPGVNCLSTIPWSKGGYGRMSGTSMATPIVAGITALCLAKHRKGKGQTTVSNPAELREHLRRTAIDRGAAGPDTEYGLGLIDPNALASIWSKEKLEGDKPPPATEDVASVMFSFKAGSSYYTLVKSKVKMKAGDKLVVAPVAAKERLWNE